MKHDDDSVPENIAALLVVIACVVAGAVLAVVLL
jgi:hypothetical protein